MTTTLKRQTVPALDIDAILAHWNRQGAFKKTKRDRRREHKQNRKEQRWLRRGNLHLLITRMATSPNKSFVKREIRAYLKRSNKSQLQAVRDKYNVLYFEAKADGQRHLMRAYHTLIQMCDTRLLAA